jgi:hypothetical protein
MGMIALTLFRWHVVAGAFLGHHDKITSVAIGKNKGVSPSARRQM